MFLLLGQDSGSLAVPVLTAPATGNVFVGEGVPWTATSDDSLDEMQLVLDPGGSEIILATDSAPAFGGTWTVANSLAAAAGAHSLVARAVKAGFPSRDSAPVPITIANPTLETIRYFSATTPTLALPADYLHPDLTRNAWEGMCWGTGGGGTAATGGGGGGGFSSKKIASTPSATHDFSVPPGAIANTAGASCTIDTTVVVALGGASGATQAGAAAGTGDVTRTGGNGVAGAGNTSGGGCAGRAANGVSTVGGAPDGGSGGGNATAGRFPGAGGGSSAGIGLGGAGARAGGDYFQPVPLAGAARIISYSEFRSPASGTSHVVTMPPATALDENGDKFFAFVGEDAAAVGSTISASAGWSQIGAQVNDGTLACSAAIFELVADGTDALTITTSASVQVSVIVLRIKGAGTADFTSATGSSTNANPPDHPPAGGADDILWLAFAVLDEQNVPFVGFPSGYTMHHIIPPIGPAGVQVALAGRYLNAASENPPVFTHSTEQWCAITMAIPPA